MTTIFLNGKFLAQRPTGVQRVARQLVLALDAMSLAEHCVLLVPESAPRLPLHHIRQEAVGKGWEPLHFWEQFTLPRAARSGLLVSLAGSAPWLARRQVALMHDAAVFDHPEAYTWPFVLWYRWLFRRLAVRAELLFTVSHFSRRQLERHLKLPSARMRVLYSGVDHIDDVQADAAFLRQLGVEGRQFLLAVGSLNPCKRLDLLVKTFAQLDQADVRLVIVGGGNDQVFSAGAGSPDPAGVLRPGPVDDRALKALYLTAQALVFPSIYEGFGLPPLEAMRCGCPVLAADAAAVREICGQAPLYHMPDSSKELLRDMRRVLAEPALRMELASAGLVRSNGFVWSAAAQALSAQIQGHLAIHGGLQPVAPAAKP